MRPTSLMVSRRTTHQILSRTREYGDSLDHHPKLQNLEKINRTLVQLIFRRTSFLMTIFRNIRAENRYFKTIFVQFELDLTQKHAVLAEESPNLACFSLPKAAIWLRLVATRYAMRVQAP